MCRAFAGAAVLVLVASACGNDDDDEKATATPPAATPTVQAATPEPEVETEPSPTPDQDASDLDVSRLFGYGFSPFFGDGEDPSDPTAELVLTEEELRDRMEPVSADVGSYRTYSCATNGLDAVGRIAADFDATAAIGAWVDANSTHTQAEIDCAVNVARQGHAEILVIGNEVIDEPATITVEQLVAYVEAAQGAAPGVPVTTAAGPDVWLNNPELIAAVDALMINVHPYWGGAHIDDAVNVVERVYRNVRDVAADKPVIIGETGWPRAGSARGNAEPSPENACRYHDEVRAWALDNEIALYYFEVYNEPWKSSAEDGGVGANWGVFDPNGSSLPCAAPPPPPPPEPPGEATLDAVPADVGHRVEVSGRIEFLQPDLAAWLVIEGDESFPNLFPQSGPLDLGTFTVCAVLGRAEVDGGKADIGKTFTALVVAADTEASSHLGNPPAGGLESLPEGASVLAAQSVTRTGSATRCGPPPEPPGPVGATVTAPANGVAQASVIAGTVTGLSPGHTARLIVRGDPGFPFYFPQPHPPLGPGPFDVCAVFGRAVADGGAEDVGKVFTIVLVEADQETGRQLDGTPPGGFDLLPDGATELARVEVQRTRSGGECAVG